MSCVTIRILHVRGCGGAEGAEASVREAVRDLELSAEVEAIEVKDAATAEALGLRGSPTITVDGVDLEEGAPPVNFG